MFNANVPSAFVAFSLMISQTLELESGGFRIARADQAVVVVPELGEEVSPQQPHGRWLIPVHWSIGERGHAEGHGLVCEDGLAAISSAKAENEPFSEPLAFVKL